MGVQSCIRPQGQGLVHPGPCWAAEPLIAPLAHGDTSVYGTNLHCLDEETKAVNLERPSDLSKVTSLNEAVPGMCQAGGPVPPRRWPGLPQQSTTGAAL